MGRADYKTCKLCGRHEREVGPISWGRLCGDCGPVRFRENLDGLVTHSGPDFQTWRRACVAAFGGVLLDDVQREA